MQKAYKLLSIVIIMFGLFVSISNGYCLDDIEVAQLQNPKDEKVLDNYLTVEEKSEVIYRLKNLSAQVRYAIEDSLGIANGELMKSNILCKLF